ncbi:hypothetical protein GcM1_098005 [Golovinomyces cichoracearum]|uniref:Uncharacterized protein n=1 Tax=Golovinomyces cichoracearum TaxID=62708 RepID=A0A420JCB0_9PEZI|nr:hypothetical protein GcM1_098005 [Golovinomyces cichoracearum]
MSQTALTYCCGWWLGKYKKQVVHCYVDQFFHGGTTTTSRLEGAHSILKQWTEKPTKDLPTTWDAVNAGQAIQRDSRVSSSSIWSKRLHGSLSFDYTINGQSTKPKLKKMALDTHCQILHPFVQRHTGALWEYPVGTLLKNVSATRRPRVGSAPIELPPPLLNLITRQRRCTQEAEKRTNAGQHARARQAASWRILGQHEQLKDQLRHCLACIEYGHDKATCRGCRATGHNRSACPNISYQRSQFQAQYPPSQQPPTFLFSQQAQLTPPWAGIGTESWLEIGSGTGSGMGLGMGLGQQVEQWDNFM